VRLLRSALKRVANTFGYDIRPKAALGRGIGVTLEHVRRLGFRPATVIDVGVADGTPDLYRQFPQSRYLLIEPLKEWEPDLQTIARTYDATYVLAAAGSWSGAMTIHVHRDLSTSSPMLDVGGDPADDEPREVPVVTIDELCKDRAMEAPYLIKIDVQGAELAVLEGAKVALAKTDLVILEVSLFQFYEGGPQFFDVVKWMKGQGFVFYDVGGGHCRPSDGALAQVDIAFVKEDGRFRQHHFYHAPRAEDFVNRVPEPCGGGQRAASNA
jgi:FkbM family methyltransferase